MLCTSKQSFSNRNVNTFSKKKTVLGTKKYMRVDTFTIPTVSLNGNEAMTSHCHP